MLDYQWEMVTYDPDPEDRTFSAQVQLNGKKVATFRGDSREAVETEARAWLTPEHRERWELEFRDDFRYCNAKVVALDPAAA